MLWGNFVIHFFCLFSNVCVSTGLEPYRKTRGKDIIKVVSECSNACVVFLIFFCSLLFILGLGLGLGCVRPYPFFPRCPSLGVSARGRADKKDDERTVKANTGRDKRRNRAQGKKRRMTPRRGRHVYIITNNNNNNNNNNRRGEGE